MTRRERVAREIDRGNIPVLLRLVEWPACACVGSVDGEPECRCKMSAAQVRDAVSLAALKRGKILRLK